MSILNSNLNHTSTKGDVGSPSVGRDSSMRELKEEVQLEFKPDIHSIQTQMFFCSPSAGQCTTSEAQTNIMEGIGTEGTASE